MRIFDLDKVMAATEQYKHKMVGFHPQEWLDNHDNIALANENGDVSLFEMGKPGVYSGHYFFFSRGRQALKTAKEMLKEAFTNYDIKIIVGISPLENLGARWMNKQLGFKSHGVTKTVAGPCELVILTKEEWENME